MRFFKGFRGSVYRPHLKGFSRRCAAVAKLFRESASEISSVWFALLKRHRLQLNKDLCRNYQR